jgi:hypothetical protein
MLDKELQERFFDRIWDEVLSKVDSLVEFNQDQDEFKKNSFDRIAKDHGHYSGVGNESPKYYMSDYDYECNVSTPLNLPKDFLLLKKFEGFIERCSSDKKWLDYSSSKFMGLIIDFYGIPEEKWTPEFREKMESYKLKMNQ